MCRCLWLIVFGLFLCSRAYGRVSLPDSPNAFSPLKETGCPAEFQGRCRCGLAPYGPKGEVQYVTNCTDAGFQEVHMLQSLPVETQVLLFTGNEVYDLPVNIFGRDAPYPNLHTVDLSDNHIQGIRGRTFHAVNSVRTLILNDNDIYVVSKDHHPRMFSNFDQLEELHLRNAFTDKEVGSLYIANVADTFQESDLVQLRKLDLAENSLNGFHDNKDIFCSLPKLEDLDLSGNRLKGLDDVSLGCLQHLKRLDLSRNRLSSLSNVTLTELDRLDSVNISSNPFVCDCRLHDTVTWVRRTKTLVANRQDLMCWGEVPLGQPLTEVREDELPCPHLEQHQVHGHLQASYAVLGLVILAACVLLIVALYRNRSVVSGIVSTCATPLRNKLHYSSLDKREEAEMEV